MSAFLEYIKYRSRVCLKFYVFSLIQCGNNENVRDGLRQLRFIKHTKDTKAFKGGREIVENFLGSGNFRPLQLAKILKS